MYEIWLFLVMFWELALLNLPVVLPALAFSLVGWVLVFRRPSSLGRGLKRAFLAGVIVALTAFVLLPGMVQSSLSELRYWLDWAALAGFSAATGGVIGALLWPWLSKGQAHDA
jgi:ABC-type Mn2+/Zn2+ transport system permease subunit